MCALWSKESVMDIREDCNVRWVFFRKVACVMQLSFLQREDEFYFVLWFSVNQASSCLLSVCVCV